MDSQHQEAQSTICTSRLAHQSTNITSEVTRDSDCPQFYDPLAYVEEAEDAYPFMPPPEASWRSDTLHDTADHFPGDVPISSFRRPPAPSIHADLDGFENDCASLVSGQHTGHPWVNDILPASISPSQLVKNYESYNENIGPATPLTDETVNFTQSGSTSIGSKSLRSSRGLPRRRSQYKVQRIGYKPNAVFIPPGSNLTDPLERWKNSPPEVEAASLSAIENALQTPPPGHMADQGPYTPDPKATDAFQQHRRSVSRAPSATSGESATTASSRHSNRSNRSALSNNSQVAGNQNPSATRKPRSGAKREKRSSANNPRIFCCTFCCDKFKSKYDWVRHEKSLHLNLESWTCAPFGGVVILPSTGRAHCAYCNQLDPTPEHLERHNHGLCQHQNKPTFRRKDHLIQHLRLFHNLGTIPLIDEWKCNIADFPSRCGFCNHTMSTWNERADHLTSHFRKGCTMAHWKGDHEFPPEIAAQITHSVPPYLLDFESRTFVPFSATDRAVNDHLSQMLSRARFENEAGKAQIPPEPFKADPSPIQNTPALDEPGLDSYTEVLTRHLSHYAQHMMSRGIIPTDEMFQSEARCLLFDSEDQWNQTMADNHEWLARFRGDQN
ncbi:uncharacterized protein APUU_20321S [Aspergillus puulaauensis]|uniref:C2H2-type domain-containing protein n=1 Tax=Aspergillus puulaauensis TaxID=1220207 RepID=A0A7R7XFV1_9EURO|nr:uncharacterized protein APUU_20321S [Aspergillus puulaauensis]BCS19889.1 hypothetical protein APUU_20321S [Aspergillus puulaauensis]